MEGYLGLTNITEFELIFGIGSEGVARFHANVGLRDECGGNLQGVPFSDMLLVQEVFTFQLSMCCLW